MIVFRTSVATRLIKASGASCAWATSAIVANRKADRDSSNFFIVTFFHFRQNEFKR